MGETVGSANTREERDRRLAADDIDRVRARLSIQEESWEVKGCINLIRQFKDSKRAASLTKLDEKIRQAEKDDDSERLAELLRERHNQAIAHDREKAIYQNKSV